MSTPQRAFSGNADTQNLARQVNIFLFDLKNEATEHGFKSDDSWTLQLATDADMVSLRRNHYPMVSVKLCPDALLNVFQQVKGKLQQALSMQEVELTVDDLTRDGITQMTAYPAVKLRK